VWFIQVSNPSTNNQFFGQSISQLISLIMNKSISQSINQSVNQSRFMSLFFVLKILEVCANAGWVVSCFSKGDAGEHKTQDIRHILNCPKY
jgi:hypothetical protein